MGCLEVEKKGIGFMYSFDLEKFKSSNWENILPKDLNKFNVEVNEHMESWQVACLMAAYVTEEEELDNFEELEDYIVKELLQTALGICFEKRYNLPKGSIRSCEDYNGDDMFFLDVMWPPEEYNEYLSKLTRDSFTDDLEEFFRDLLGGSVSIELEVCEEYIKW